jgi:hypothetical protein
LPPNRVSAPPLASRPPSKPPDPSPNFLISQSHLRTLSCFSKSLLIRTFNKISLSLSSTVCGTLWVTHGKDYFYCKVGQPVSLQSHTTSTMNYNHVIYPHVLIFLFLWEKGITYFVMDAYYGPKIMYDPSFTTTTILILLVGLTFTFGWPINLLTYLWTLRTRFKWTRRQW